MTASARLRPRYSYAEYLAYERDSELKHEFDDGEIIAMAGGSRRHNALALRIGAVLDAARKPGRVAFQSDQRIRVLATGKATYPDVSMVCGPIEGDPADPEAATLTNPTLIVEVLSPTTEPYDRGSKWQQYQLIPSLQEYVLISQGEPRIEIYRRLSSGAWEYTDVNHRHGRSHERRSDRSRASLRRPTGLIVQPTRGKRRSAGSVGGPHPRESWPTLRASLDHDSRLARRPAALHDRRRR